MKISFLVVLLFFNLSYSLSQNKFKYLIDVIKVGESKPFVPDAKNFIVLDHDQQFLEIFYNNADKSHLDLTKYQTASFDFEDAKYEGFSYVGLDKDAIECSFRFFYCTKYDKIVIILFYNNLDYTTYMCSPL